MKKNNKTILVSGASGIVGYGILKSLRQANNGYQLIGTTIYPDSVADAFCDICEIAPMTGDPDYFSWLVETIQKHNVEMIIPSIETDVIYWNKFKSELEDKTNAFVLLNNSQLIHLCEDKWLFYEALNKHHSLYAIPSYLEVNNCPLTLPFLLKPRRGYASKGIVIIKDWEALNEYKDRIGRELMIQPIIGSIDEEYTVSAFFDQHSQLCTHMSLKRKLSTIGFTETAETIEIDGIETILKELAELFKPVGPTNFQFRKHNGQLKLLEINPRISSATSIRAAFGYNESLMSVNYFLNNKTPTQPDLKKGRAVRYTEDVIYYDRTYL